jgi:hypothetical protein
MKLEYTLTLEEFREMSTVVNNVPRRERPLYQLLVWLFLFCAGIFNVYLAGATASLQARNPSVQDDRLGRQNLWTCLSPQLSIATFLLIGVVSNPVRANVLQGRTPAQKRRLRTAGMVSWLSLVWLVPCVWPRLEIAWTPTEGQVLWASFCPWFLYFAIVRPIISLRRRRLVDKTWEAMSSLRRENRLEISPEGIVSDDGLAETRFKWGYFGKYGEAKNLLLLFTQDGSPLMIPKRAVADDRAMDQLKMLISENIAEGEFAKKQNAFAVIFGADQGKSV